MTRWQRSTSTPTTFRGAHFAGANFTGATFRDCDLRHLKIVDSWEIRCAPPPPVGGVVKPVSCHLRLPTHDHRLPTGGQHAL